MMSAKVESDTPKRYRNNRFLDACAGRPVDATPLWIMRQAGRYLPEYRELRRKADFLTFCKTPDLICQATAVAAEAIGVDVAIIFSDILIPLEAMGMKLIFEESGGPKLPEPLRSPQDLARLRIPEAGQSFGFLLEGIHRTKERLAGEIPLIGFAGAPFTLAAYAIDGGTSKSYSRTLTWMHRDPESFDKLLDLLSRVIIVSLTAQIKAGCDAVQIFDSWGGFVGAREYRAIFVPHLRRIVEALRPTGVPVILYINGSTHLLSAMAETGATVLSVDWRLPLDEVRRRVGPEPVLQGNLDPFALYAPRERIEAEVRRILREAGPRKHILNLGHGIQPDTPVDGARAMVEACHGFRHEEAS